MIEKLQEVENRFEEVNEQSGYCIRPRKVYKAYA